MASWSVPREWIGETAVCYGGGPSLNQSDVDYAKTRFRRIACNDSFLLDPDCDVLAFGDAQWFLWNRHDIRQHIGRYKITWQHVPQIAGHTIHFLKKVKGPGLAVDPSTIVPGNTGLGAIQIAAHFGVARILLVGFDMKPVDGRTHWHQRHQTPTNPGRMQRVFAPAITRAAEELKARGIEVINCTSGSALTCFPFADIRDIQ